MAHATAIPKKRTRITYVNDHFDYNLRITLLPLRYYAIIPYQILGIYLRASHEECFHHRRIPVDYGFMERSAPTLRIDRRKCTVPK
jgi:hypothetical protein